MKKVLIACDSFKGSATAVEVVSAIYDGMVSVVKNNQIMRCPLADGGEGSLEAISGYVQGEWVEVMTVDALNRPVKTTYLYDSQNKFAYIEMANSVGIELLKTEELNPMQTSSYGLGLVIKEAIQRKASQIVLFVGGSATNDFGIGAAQAMGVQFALVDGAGSVLKGKDLNKIKDYEVPSFLKNIDVKVATDVTNPLYGKEGATRIYGPQKGGKENDLQLLEKAIKSLANKIKTKKDVDLQNIPGSGAAGGVAAGMIAFFDARIISGAEFIFDLIDLKNKVAEADLVITGEGKMDSQTLHGKLVYRLATMAKEYNKKVIAVCGKIDLDNSNRQKLGIYDEYSIIKWTNNAAYSKKSTILHLREIGASIAYKYLVE